MARKIYAVVTTTVNDEKGTSINIGLKKVRGVTALDLYRKAFRHLPKLDMRRKFRKSHPYNLGYDFGIA